MFVGAETGILKGVNVNNKASISKGSNINTYVNRLFAMREITSPSLSNSRCLCFYVFSWKNFHNLSSLEKQFEITSLSFGDTENEILLGLRNQTVKVKQPTWRVLSSRPVTYCFL